MPRYDFRCEDCQVTTEITRHVFVELQPPACNKCNRPMTRIYNPTPAIFKGDGWAGKS